MFSKNFILIYFCSHDYNYNLVIFYIFFIHEIIFKGYQKIKYYLSILIKYKYWWFTHLISISIDIYPMSNLRWNLSVFPFFLLSFILSFSELVRQMANTRIKVSLSIFFYGVWLSYAFHDSTRGKKMLNWKINVCLN